MRQDQRSSPGIAGQKLSAIESLIQHKEFKRALAELRDLQNHKEFSSLMDESGELNYSLALALQGVGNYEEALSKAQKSFEILRNSSESEKLAKAQFIIGIIYSDLGDLKRSELELRDALAIFRRIKNDEGVIESYNELARIHFVRTECDKAAEYLKEGLSFCERMNDHKRIARFCGNLGRTYLLIGRWKEARENLLRSLESNELNNNLINICCCYLSLGYVCFLQRNFAKATEYYEKALKLIYENNYMREMAIYYEYYGELAFAQGNYFLAKDHCRNGIKIGEEIAPEGDIISQTYRLLAEVQIAEKQYDEALSSCGKALKVATSLGEKIEIGAIHRGLGQIYTAKKEKGKAKESFEKAVSILEQIGAKFELGKAYLEAGKSDCFEYFIRLKFLGRAEDLFKELGSAYYQGLVNLSLAHLLFEHSDLERSLLFLNSAEKIFQQLPEEKGLIQVSDLKKRLSFTPMASSFPQKVSFSHVIAQSPEMLSVIDKAKQIKDSIHTILLEGETGTGKDLLARAIHGESRYKDKPFVPVNCAAIPKDLVESELFGYKKGAFTGASTDKKGLIEEAEGGTLFLNEVADLPLLIQAKLLGAIEDKQITRLGDTKPRQVDFRIIAASNKDLQEQVRSGNFREDLYYRLSVIKLVLPPLRDRKGDIPVLLNHFLRKHFGDDGNELSSIHPQILKILEGYHWPGNVRELQNEIIKLVTLKGGENGDGSANLPDKFLCSPDFSEEDPPTEVSSLYDQVTQYEKELILKALEENDWIKVKAAKALKMPAMTLNNKIKKYHIEIPI
ncbi:MAG: sigma 54-interacting transcriptional regulator [Candidatus Zixiibacteriota bacterium]